MGGSSKKRSASMVEDSDGPEESVAPSIKKTKNAAAAAQPSGKDDDGNPYWELTNNRRVGVSKFKNMALINVREYYEKDGKMLPGKKGISLSVEQYRLILKHVPGINAALQELGEDVDDVDDTNGAPSATKPKKGKSKPSKANIEATSDEESA